MATWLKVTPNTHTARKSPHESTSYSILALLLFAVGVALSFYTVSAADLSWSRPLPAEGSIGISGKVPGKPPAIAATINTPTDGQRFTTSPVEITGTCPAETLVEIFRNDIFAGSTICDNKGAYKVMIDLLSGNNTFVARVYDALNQAGPDSKNISIFFDFIAANAAPSSLDFGGTQMIIQTDAVFRGAYPGKEMSIPIGIIGGVPPYAVNVQWGDLKNTLHSRADNQPFNSAHTYTKPGIYQLALQATDSQGRVAFITVAAIVNGQPDTTIGATDDNKPSSLAGHLMALWPLYTAAVAMVVSFWLGEKRQKHALAAHGQLLTP